MKKVLLLILMTAVLNPVLAKELFVDGSSGNDSVSYADNSVNNPWQSLGRAVWGSTTRASPNAAEAAQAGDIVTVSAGTYVTSQVSGERWVPAYNPANNGSASNPIVFRADGLVILESNSAGSGGPIIGAQGKGYITWDGFYLDEANIQTVSDTGPVVVWDANNITIKNLTISGVTSAWNDNHNAIRLEYATDSLVANNRIFGTRNAGANANGSAIMSYRSSNVVIEHNEISDAGGGIFLKGVNTGPFTVRYNVFHNIDSAGVIIGGVGTSVAQNGADIYQNIFRDSVEGVSFIGYDTYSPANINVVNNTFDNLSNGAIFLKPSTAGYLNILVQNNISTNSNLAIQGEDISDLSQVAFTHNLYSGNTEHGRIAYTNYSFANWQSNLSKDTSGSIVADPEYIDYMADNFKLAGTSPAKGMGVDILNLNGAGTSAAVDAGAYITGSETIGIVPTGAAVPKAPTLFIVP